MSQFLDSLEAITGHRFSSTPLIEEALTHPSVGGARNYQRLEFLGDRVLGLVIAAWLYKSFPGEVEGSLNRRFAALVRRETCADVALEAGLDDQIRIDSSADFELGRGSHSALGDACEAVIGALFIDGGIEAAQAFIERYWRARLEEGPGLQKDPKSELQEWAQGHGLPLPRYKTTQRSGPDHSPEFTIKVTVEGLGSATASGGTKRLAEQAAAEKMLADVEEQTDRS